MAPKVIHTEPLNVEWPLDIKVLKASDEHTVGLSRLRGYGM